jgi:AraC-like DNA-binding protein
MASFSNADWIEFRNKQHGPVPVTPQASGEIWHYPHTFAHGYLQWVDLRDGIGIEILEAQFHEQLQIHKPEMPAEEIQLHFHLQGHHTDIHTTVNNNEFSLKGIGSVPKHTLEAPPQDALELSIVFPPQALQSFIADPTGELPPALRRLVQPIEQESYARVGKLTPQMKRILWQILRCPHHGFYRQLFLESKVLDLALLVLSQEQTLYDNPALDTRERVHYAREVLRKNMHQPPSLSQLARQALLNEATLKRHFKQEFGKTIFDYLLEYRLEQARQMLAEQTIPVADVMTAVGLQNRSYFAAAFRKQFGVNPKQYQKQHR